jgi:hypothetical protein
MRPEDILYEAEKVGLRIKVLETVGELKEKVPNMPYGNLYDVAWEMVKQENQL